MRDLVSRLSAALGDRYEIERELGRGGAATVFAVRDVRHGRTVALKVMDVGEAGGGERFQREIAIISSLRHPHIVPLFDSGQVGDLCYYVMPLMEGRTLRDRLREASALPVDEALRIAAEVADALEYAHRQGVIHRDVKPENILLDGAHATVADFGIARPSSSPDGEGPDRLTVTGVVVGTPAYMSPEQVSGALNTDQRSDEYALGCVVYEMLSGRPPFSDRAGRPVIVQHLTDPAPALTVGGRAVRAAVARALAKDPTERFPSVGAFAAALAGETETGLSRARRIGSRAAWAAGLAIVALTLGALVLPRILSRRGAVVAAPEIVSVAILPLANLGANPENAYFSDGVLEDVLVALNRVPRLSVSPRTSSFRFTGASLSLRAIAESLSVANVVEGSVRREGSTLRITLRLVHVPRTGADSTIWSDEYTRRMENVLSLQTELAGTIASHLLSTLLPTDRAALAVRSASSPEAYDRYLKGRYHWYRRDTQSLLQAIKFYREALAIDSGYALAWAGLADAYSLLSASGGMRPVDSRPLATAAADRALALDSRLAEAHVSMGIVHTFFDWDWTAAKREFARALAIDSTSSHAQLFATWPLVASGELEAALASIRRAQRLDPLALVINTRAATVLEFMHRYPEAEVAARRTLEIDPQFANAQLELARVLAVESRTAEALSALPPPERMRGIGSVESGIPGFVLALAGRTSEARREIAMLEGRSGADDAVAAIYAALGDKDSAMLWLERSARARDFTSIFLNVNPMFDSLHGDPRFQRLVSRIGLR
jgi:serine/threonine-protein kinase